ncbi:MarR family transcriptional regulator [Actinomyces qiguomingii]|uniref:MarR family transcriptional regulator n=1 Tax=Actinomyces qiguomingii TaxID=2057800 RepID=UPI000FFEDFA4|nr:MarR family transcriptional regulator [Actinomyces qiguomingii]
MYVFTVDQVASRAGEDEIPGLVRLLADIPTSVPFERTVGDEAQGVVRDADAAVTCARRLMTVGGWHIGLGIGSGRLGEQGARSGAGAAFIAARQAVEESKSSRLSLAVRTGASGQQARIAAGDAEAVLRLLGVLIRSRTAAQRAVLALLDDGLSGKEAAERLGVSGQAVSKHRLAARYDEEIAALPAIERLLGRAHRLSVAPEATARPTGAA